MRVGTRKRSGGASGDTGSFDSTTSQQVSLSAQIEHDGYGDGDGDETQDGCPTDPTTHDVCDTADPAPGTSATFNANNRLIDVSAVLEADGDGDGYGDTSQDACPTDASTQGTCPMKPPPGKSAKCLAAEGKLAKAKAKLKKLKKSDAPAKKVKKAKKKVKKAKDAVKKAC